MNRPARSGRPKVIYIVGAGRSGSSILGVTLGNCKGIFYAGELDKWLLRAGKPQLGGESSTRFWEQVRASVADAEPLFDNRVHHFIERSSALLRARRRSVRRQVLEPYRRVTTALYEAVAVASGVDCIVDSSHYPLRAHELQALDGIDLYLIFLIRDPRQVIASFARGDVDEPRFAANKTRVYLLLTYLLSARVFVGHPRARRAVISHEDFLENPEGVLRSLLEHLDCDPAVPDLASLRTGTPFQGNRLLRDEVVTLQRRTVALDRSFTPAGVFDQLMWAALARLRPRVKAARADRASSPAQPGAPLSG